MGFTRGGIRTGRRRRGQPAPCYRLARGVGAEENLYEGSVDGARVESVVGGVGGDVSVTPAVGGSDIGGLRDPAGTDTPSPRTFASLVYGLQQNVGVGEGLRDGAGSQGAGIADANEMDGDGDDVGGSCDPTPTR